MGLSWYQLRNYAAVLALSLTALLLSAAANADISVTVETQVYDLGDDAPAQASTHMALARYGPFNMVAANRAELNGTIETNTPAQFRAMLSAYPALNQIDMIDCPGTDDDKPT
jgi:hypothetical protein